MSLRQIFKGSYISGQFLKPQSGIEWQRVHPLCSDEVLYEWREDPSLVEVAVSAGVKAFPAWSRLSIDERIEKLQGMKGVFERKASQFEEAIILETGKARWEAKIEAASLVKKWQITVDTMLPLIREMESRFSSSATEQLTFRARGLCVVLGPFNFPMHLAHGHIVPALLAGNTVVFKPSEWASACASLYAEALHELGLEEGVFQVLCGGQETGRRLVENAEVKGVFFTGSYAVGRKITESLLKSRPDLSTSCALEMGGKNAMIIDSSVPLDKAVSDSLLSAYATAGQRCSCASRIFVEESMIEDFQKLFLSKLKQLAFGDPADSQTFMGPVIHQEAAKKFLMDLEQAQKTGLKVILESQQADPKSALLSPALYRSLNPSEDVHGFGLQEEFFGPQTCLIPYRQPKEVVEWHEAAAYALVTSVYSQDKKIFDFYAENLSVGLLNFNRPSVGASSSLPFGGLKRSGNNWPAGLFSYFYCSYPQSRLLGKAEMNLESLPQSLRVLFEGKE